MKYIDAEKLKEELEMRKTVYIGHALSLRGTNLIDGFDEALSIIDSLQQEQPEVDLEKEIIRYQREDMDRDTTVGDVARHFYGLRLNARKEESK